MSDNDNTPPPATDTVALAIMVANMATAYVLGRAHAHLQASDVTSVSRSVNHALDSLTDMYGAIIIAVSDQNWLLNELAPLMVKLIVSSSHTAKYVVSDEIDALFKARINRPATPQEMTAMMATVDKAIVTVAEMKKEAADVTPPTAQAPSVPTSTPKKKFDLN